MAEASFFTQYASPLGPLTLACRGEAVTGLWLPGQRYFARTLPAGAVPGPDAAPLKLASAWLDRYFAGERPDVSALTLAPEGTAFQRRVWALLPRIPYGQTRSYGELAVLLASSPRAVGAAVGRNPISLLIPCHRVLGADGSLTGYAGGLEKKLWLLRHEGAL